MFIIDRAPKGTPLGAFLSDKQLSSKFDERGILNDQRRKHC